jgi:hypothetical protein
MVKDINKVNNFTHFKGNLYLRLPFMADTKIGKIKVWGIVQVAECIPSSMRPWDQPQYHKLNFKKKGQNKSGKYL